MINIINLGSIHNNHLSLISAIKIHISIAAALVQKKARSSLSDSFVCEYWR